MAATRRQHADQKGERRERQSTSELREEEDDDGPAPLLPPLAGCGAMVAPVWLLTQ